MTRAGIALAAVVAVAFAAGLAFLSTRPSTETAPAPARPVSVSTSVAPRPAFFGDPVTARAEVLVDGRRVDPDSVTFDADFVPYALVGAPQESRSDGAGSTSIGLRFALSCLDEACLPDRRGNGPPLPPLRVRAALRTGGTADLSVPWPRVELLGRVSTEALTASTPPWRLELGLPAVTYRVSPGLLTGALTAGAAALFLGAAALVAHELLRRRRLLAERRPARSALARALELAREAAGRPPDDRRRALALLARVLAFHPRGGRDPADAAERLAWARPEPSPARITALVDRLERTVGSA